MAIILLDENFYKEDTHLEYHGYFKKLMEFITKYFDVDIALFIPNANLSEIWSSNNLISQINREIQKTGQFEIINELNVVSCSDDKFNVLSFSNSIIGEIYYLHEHFQDVIIPLSPDRHEQNIKQIMDYVYFINHIYKELDSNIGNWISKNIYTHNIITPLPNSPLPNTDLCHEYKNLQDELIIGKDIPSRIPIFLQVVSEVLRRNSYIRDEYLSSINTTKKKIREIFRKDDLSLYGSIDIDTGSIEICDHNGHHIDEYGFDNKKHNKHDSTGKHDIKLHS